MNLNRILAMMKKEVLQIRRDPRSLLIILLMPVLQLFIYGYALNLDVHHVPLCVYDEDGTQFSQDFLKNPDGRGFWDILFRIGLGAGVAFALFFFAVVALIASNLPARPWPRW